ncbi:DUF2554 family protein [Buttiauxella gaviniae]|uniref:DUF2554 family protein n=1 Tax=Buttiauxella gaviniae TaxID=82990 RepID=A0ABV3P014_9ENTR
MVKQLRSKLGVILLLIGAALFSGQTTAQTHGHDYLIVKSADMLLRHQADSDELRQSAEDSAADFREHHYYVKERRPGTYQL